MQAQSPAEVNQQPAQEHQPSTPAHSDQTPLQSQQSREIQQTKPATIEEEREQQTDFTEQINTPELQNAIYSPSDSHLEFETPAEEVKTSEEGKQQDNQNQTSQTQQQDNQQDSDSHGSLEPSPEK